MIHAIQSKTPPKDGIAAHENPQRRGQRKRKHVAAPANDAVELSARQTVDDGEGQSPQQSEVVDLPPTEDEELGGSLDLRA
jgi:hypothetical protein